MVRGDPSPRLFIPSSPRAGPLCLYPDLLGVSPALSCPSLPHLSRIPAGLKSAPPAPRPSTARLSSPPDEVLQKRVRRAQGARPCPACAQRIRPAPALAGGGVAGRGGTGNRVAISCRHLLRQCLQPAPLAAGDNLVSRDSLVFLLNCVITLVRPLRGRQTGFPCLQAPATGRRSSCQLGPLLPPPLRSCAQPPHKVVSGRGRRRHGDKPPSPAGPVSGPGFLCRSLHTQEPHLILETATSPGLTAPVFYS